MYIDSGMDEMMDVYPIRESMLSHLPATSASSLMDATGHTFTDRERAEYTDMLRDIPEHVDWIQDCISKGSEVMLIGQDVKRWRERISDPSSYEGGRWKTPIRVWLLVTVPELTARERLSTNMGVWMVNATTGNLLHVDYDRVDEHRTMGYSETLFLSGPGGTTELRDYDGWHMSKAPNESNIQVLYFLGTKYGRHSCVAGTQVNRVSVRPRISSIRAGTIRAESRGSTLEGFEVPGGRWWDIPLINYERIDHDHRMVSLPYVDLKTRIHHVALAPKPADYDNFDRMMSDRSTVYVAVSAIHPHTRSTHVLEIPLARRTS